MSTHHIQSTFIDYFCFLLFSRSLIEMETQAHTHTHTYIKRTCPVLFRSRVVSFFNRRKYEELLVFIIDGKHVRSMDE
jgi:hypothetical protein